MFPAMQAAKSINGEQGRDSRPDLRHVRAWIFDLDHTLYTQDKAQTAAMENRICRFVQDRCGLGRASAWELQKRYLRDYGSTLVGLAAHHGIDPETFHDAVNDVEALALSPDGALRAALARLPGKRIVFTNNCGRFGVDVLRRLAIDDLFSDIVDARALGFTPKPNPAAYQALLARCALDPARAALFDDSARNLVPARALGITTIWFNNGLGQAHWRIERPELHIDFETSDLAQFLQAVRI